MGERGGGAAQEGQRSRGAGGRWVTGGGGSSTNGVCVPLRHLQWGEAAAPPLLQRHHGAHASTQPPHVQVCRASSTSLPSTECLGRGRPPACLWHTLTVLPPNPLHTKP